MGYCGMSRSVVKFTPSVAEDAKATRLGSLKRPSIYCGVDQQVRDRVIHNHEDVGSNPTPATSSLR